jgi:hypothetical protein
MVVHRDFPWRRLWWPWNFTERHCAEPIGRSHDRAVSSSPVTGQIGVFVLDTIDDKAGQTLQSSEDFTGLTLSLFVPWLCWAKSGV